MRDTLQKLPAGETHNRKIFIWRLKKTILKDGIILSHMSQLNLQKQIILR